MSSALWPHPFVARSRRKKELSESKYLTIELAAHYIITLIAFRLFLHPLVSFPGLWLALISYLFDGCYDMVRGGHWAFKIRELCKHDGNDTRGCAPQIFLHRKQRQPLSLGPVF